MSKKELSNLRNQINKLDEKLFSMIFKRMNIAKKIGEIKVQHNIEITNSDRENELIKHILGLPDNSLDQDEIESIYKLFFSISMYVFFSGNHGDASFIIPFEPYIIQEFSIFSLKLTLRSISILSLIEPFNSA